LLNTLKEFSDVSQVSAYLCPAIGFEAFEVGPEVKGAFPDAPETCFRNGEGDRWYADLFELARWQLIRAGIGSVHGGGICTFEDESGYFSYRRDGVTGRQVSLIWKA
jgi:copper oxidase (laccase) domain-containing protein